MVKIMNSINIKDYKPYMGTLIDIRDPITYKESPTNGSINIYYEKLLMNYKTMLDKNKRYFLICGKGKKSKEVTRILEYYGYDVVNVVK